MRAFVFAALILFSAFAYPSSVAAQSFDYRALQADPTVDRVAKIMAQVALEGRGDHHFVLSYCSTAPGVVLPPDVRTQHPVEITIVLEWQYDDLVVSEHEIRVTVSFNSQPARIVIPLAALTSFSDPSVGLQVWLRSGATSEARCTGIGDII